MDEASFSDRLDLLMSTKKWLENNGFDSDIVAVLRVASDFNAETTRLMKQRKGEGDD